MNEYKRRITTNGYTFKVQWFCDLFWVRNWVNERGTVRKFDGPGGYDLEFKTQDAAQKYIDDETNREKASNASFQPITVEKKES